MRDEDIREMYPALTPAQRAVYARLGDQFEEVKACLLAICWQVNPVINEDVVDDALCGPTIHLLRCLCDDIDWYVSEYMEADDDGGLEHSGDTRDEAREGDDPARAGASSRSGKAPATSEAAASHVPNPPPATVRERLQLLRERNLARSG